MKPFATALLIVFLLAADSPPIVRGQSAAPAENATGETPPDDQSAVYTVEIVLRGLEHPSGLALRKGEKKAGPHELFLAESGAGRVVRVTTSRPENIQETITGFPKGAPGKTPADRTGLLGILFLTRTKLIVCGGGAQENQETVRVYALPTDGSPLTAEQTDHSVGLTPGDDRSNGGARNFHALTKTDTAVFVTSSGDGQQGWILKAGIEANRLAFLQPFIATTEATGGVPTAIAVIPKPRPQFLVVAQRGKPTAPRDSRLSFYVPSSAALALSLPTGLHEIVGLAYSPSGQLYAIDFAGQNSAEGGVYRLDDARVNGKQTCRSVKIAAVARPTALAFTPDGVLYVTALGNEEDAQQGVLLKIIGDL